MLSYIYDAAVVLIMVICIGRGFKKGVLRAVLGLICSVVAFIAAAAISSYNVCSQIYDDYFSEMIRERIDVSVQDAKKEASEKLRTEAKNAIDQYIDEHLGGSEELKQIIRDILETDDETIQSVTRSAYEFIGIDIDTLLTNEEISGKIKQAAEDYSGIVTDKINSRLPYGLSVSGDDVKKVMSDTNASESLIYELFGISSENNHTKNASEYIEENIVRPVAIRMISAVLWAVSFAAVNMILRLVVSIILVIRHIDAVKTCDSVLGGILGAAGGMAVAAASVVVVVLIIRTTGGFDYMNEDIISDTFIFSKMYSFIKGFII